MHGIYVWIVGWDEDFVTLRPRKKFGLESQPGAAGVENSNKARRPAHFQACVAFGDGKSKSKMGRAQVSLGDKAFRI